MYGEGLKDLNFSSYLNCQHCFQLSCLNIALKKQPTRLSVVSVMEYHMLGGLFLLLIQGMKLLLENSIKNKGRSGKELTF